MLFQAAAASLQAWTPLASSAFLQTEQCGARVWSHPRESQPTQPRRQGSSPGWPSRAQLAPCRQACLKSPAAPRSSLLCNAWIESKTVCKARWRKTRQVVHLAQIWKNSILSTGATGSGVSAAGLFCSKRMNPVKCRNHHPRSNHHRHSGETEA